MKVCTLCIMDESDPNLQFDPNGVCSYHSAYNLAKESLDSELASKSNYLKELKSVLKTAGKGKDYDCLIGLSGGVDSSYITMWAGQNGINPLIVHFDNGWNSELAVSNIEKLVNKYDFDLHTLVVDWDEFKDIQLSFFKAGVPNIEMVSDHAIIATLYKVAKKYGIKHIVSGSNLATESILPDAWGYDSSDFYHIKAIQKQFGSKKIKTFPHLSLYKWAESKLFSKLKKINILNFMDYSKSIAIMELEKEVGWEYYGGKHYESVFTRIFQAYVLPHKFGFDKRKAHLSSLILSGEISREQALKEMEEPLYDSQVLEEHIEYLIKKWEITRQEFDDIMKSPPKSHFDYPNRQNLINRLVKLKNIIKL